MTISAGSMGRFGRSLVLIFGFAALSPMPQALAQALASPKPTIVDMTCNDTQYFFNKFNLSELEVYKPEFPQSQLSDAGTIKVTIHQAAEVVWKYLLVADPNVIWSNQHLQFQVAYSGPAGVGSPWPGLKLGDKFFLNLRMKYLDLPCTMMIGFQFTQIDSEKMRLETRYLDGTPNFGVQTITLKAIDAGHTEITHTSLYQGRNRIFGYFYPQAHHLAIGEFYQVLKQQLESVPVGQLPTTQAGR